MARWRIAILTVAALVLSHHPAAAQDYSLAEDLENSSFRIQLQFELKGKVTVQQEGKPLSFPHAAKGSHDFLERILDSKDHVAIKSARYYHKAEVSVSDDMENGKRSLEPTLLVAHRVKDQTLIYDPKKPLTQPELELTEHFDTLHLSGLLPGKKVAVGDSWKVPIPVAQAICDFDGLIEHDLTGKLEKVSGNVAEFSIIGKATGIDMGTEVKLLVEARGEFDLKKQRLTRLVWKQSDQRQQGPISPALSADVTVELTRTPIDEPKELNNFALVPIPNGLPPDELLALPYRDEKKRFSFEHSRDWHPVGVKNDQVVLRLLDRGDFVAQVTITPYKKVAPAKMLTLDEFADLMADAPAWQPVKLLEKTDKVDVPKLRVFRVAAEGDLDGVRAVQFFYLVGGPEGEQMIVTFTMTPAQVGKLDARDLTFVRSIRLESMLREEKVGARP